MTDKPWFKQPGKLALPKNKRPDNSPEPYPADDMELAPSGEWQKHR